MINTEELYKKLSSNDPIIKSKAVEEFKNLSIRERNIFIAEVDGGLTKISELIAERKPPDTSNIQLKKQRIVKRRQPPPPPTVEKTIERGTFYKFLKSKQWEPTINNCSKHPKDLALVIEQKTQFCLGCAVEANKLWKEMNQ